MRNGARARVFFRLCFAAKISVKPTNPWLHCPALAIVAEKMVVFPGFVDNLVELLQPRPTKEIRMMKPPVTVRSLKAAMARAAVLALLTLSPFRVFA